MKIIIKLKFKTETHTAFIIYMGKNYIDLDFQFDERLCRGIQDNEITRNGEFFLDYKFIRKYNKYEN